MIKRIQVVDEFDNPLVGAHVLQNDKGSVTQWNGVTYINSSYPGKVIISYVGTESQTHSFDSIPEKIIMKMESLNEVHIVANKPDSGMPKYLIPAIGATAALLILMSASSGSPKKVTL